MMRKQLALKPKRCAVYLARFRPPLRRDLSGRHVLHLPPHESSRALCAPPPTPSFSPWPRLCGRGVASLKLAPAPWSRPLQSRRPCDRKPWRQRAPGAGGWRELLPWARGQPAGQLFSDPSMSADPCVWAWASFRFLPLGVPGPLGCWGGRPCGSVMRATGHPGVSGRGGLQEASPGRQCLWRSGRVTTHLWGHIPILGEGLGAPWGLAPQGTASPLTSLHWSSWKPADGRIQLPTASLCAQVRPLAYRWPEGGSVPGPGGGQAASCTSLPLSSWGSGSSLSPAATRPAGTRSASRQGWPLLLWVRLHKVSKAASGCRSLQDTVQAVTTGLKLKPVAYLRQISALRPLLG